MAQNKVATESKRKPQETLPAEFPKLKNTGNMEKDNAEYAKAKAEWVSRNKDKYEKVHTREMLPARVEEQEKLRKKDKENETK